MAGLATRLGGSGLPGLCALTGSAKLLAVPNTNTKVSSANIYSKTSGNIEPRLRPWPYKELGFGYLMSLIDGTTKRFNDNSKVIVVEGPPGLEKSKFAKELADELDMRYVPGASMEDYYVNPYGYDLRDLDYLMTYEKNKSFDEKVFAKNPMATDGGLDRMIHHLANIRLSKYVDLLAHLFNTGEGIVTEKSPYSEYVFMEAAYRQGWIDRTTRIYLNKIRAMTLPMLMKPNLIIYLDAPVDVVQSKIRARAKTTHPWEENSPVYENTAYLTSLYEDLMKKEYIAKAAINSRVLMYDWSEGGDTEVVVEDIERLNMDYFDKYDKQQADWRLHKEENYAKQRIIYTNRGKVLINFWADYWDCDKLMYEPHEMDELQWNIHKLPGNTYDNGMNADVGDNVPNIIFGAHRNYFQRKERYYTMDSRFVSGEEWQHYLALREARKERGEPNWWH